jgi:hypothetical protein
MKYSFVFCYRDREAHLKITCKELSNFLRSQHMNVEFIIAEQADRNKFRRGNLLNEGARIATGDILVLHDIDYLPSGIYHRTYYDEDLMPDIFLPISKVEFLNNDFTYKKIEDIPSGYRHFKDGVDENFFGGIEVFKRDIFFHINGFPANMIGWGEEDRALRERIIFYGYTAMRGSSKFYALEHKDNGPPLTDPDFINNIKMANNWKSYLNNGINTKRATVKEIECPYPELEIDKWIQCTNFEE